MAPLRIRSLAVRAVSMSGCTCGCARSHSDARRRFSRRCSRAMSPSASERCSWSVSILLRPAGAPGEELLARLRMQLLPSLELRATRAQLRETLAMTDAFTTNLKAMSLLALLVGAFLIYGAVSFAVLQRRPIMAVLRALGATRGQVLGLVLAEAAALGIVGAVCGVLLGLVMGRGLVGLVSQTINDLYFVVAVREIDRKSVV